MVLLESRPRNLRARSRARAVTNELGATRARSGASSYDSIGVTKTSEHRILVRTSVKLPDAFNRVRVEGAVSRDDRHVFGHRLRDQ